MVDWKNIATKAGKGVFKVTKKAAQEVETKAKNVSLKNQILNKMYPGVIKKLAHEKGLRPQSFDGGRPTIDDYKRSIILHVSLDDIVDFARRTGVPIRDLTEKRDKELAEKEIKIISEQADLDEMLREVANEISKFNPSRHFDSEFPFQLELKPLLTS